MAHSLLPRLLEIPEPEATAPSLNGAGREARAGVAPSLTAVEAERELAQLRRAETIVLAIRWVVMIAWLPIFAGLSLPTTPATFRAVLGAVVLYTLLTHYLVRRSRAIRATAVFTALGDAAGVFAMCMVTGGIDSPIYAYFYLHLLTTAIRFGGISEALAALALDVALTLCLFVFAPGPAASQRQLGLDVYYLFLVALIVGMLSRDARSHHRRALREGDKAGLLLAVNRQISATLDLTDLLSRLLRELVRVMACRGAAVILLDRSGERVERIVSAGDFPQLGAHDLDASLREGLLARAVRDGAVVLEGAPALADGLRGESLRRFVSRHLAVVPVDRRRPLAFFVVADKPSPARLDGEDLALLVAVAEQAAVAIEHARLMTEVKEARDRRGELLGQLIHAQEEERKRLAGDIHDRMGHRFFEFYYGVERCRNAVSSESAAARVLDQLGDDARACADEIREIMNELRPSVLDDFGFVGALRESVAALSAQTKLAVTLSVDEGLEIPTPEVNVLLFRIFQEAVLNVRKHAGAQRLAIRLGSDGEGGLDLAIRDDGCGFDAGTPPRGHYGLLYMRERAEACGGRLDVSSEPGKGTEVHVRVPAAYP